MKVYIIYYSMYGHLHRLAEAMAEGVREVAGAEAVLRRVPETLSHDVLAKMGALGAQESMSHIPFAAVDDLKDADAVIFGSPTRFGSMTAQMKAFIDATGKLWAEGALVGKPASVFTSTATQHGGQESTILGFHVPLLHHGMVVIGLPYSFPGLTRIDEMSGASPYGASTITGGKGERFPSENEIAAARFQGKHVASIALKLTS